MATRRVLVRVLRGNRVSFTEEVTVNEKNRITIHNHPMDAIIDEGPEGQPFEKVYKHVEQVIFTGQQHLISYKTPDRMELVIVIATPKENV
jgi:hypothetical protein